MRPSDAVALARKLTPEFRAEGRRRQAAGGRREKLKGAHDTGRLIAEQCGYSAKTIAKASKVVDAAEADPIKFGHVLRRMDESGNVEAAYGAVTYSEMERLLTQPEIFGTTLVGGIPLGNLSAPDVRWLVGLFAALASCPGFSRREALSAAEMFTADDVGRAIEHADQARRAGPLLEKAFGRNLPDLSSDASRGRPKHRKASPGMAGRR